MVERQTNLPLYPKVLWNRPVSRAQSGRLLIVGGRRGAIAVLQSVFQTAVAAGIGQIKILAPDVLKPLLSGVAEASFGPSTNSGSLARLGLDLLTELASDADAALLGADLSNSSETAILAERFIASYHQGLILVADAIPMIAQSPDVVRQRPRTLLVFTMQELFKLAGKLGLPIHIRPEAGLAAKVEIASDFWELSRIDLALIGPEIIIRSGSKTSITPLPPKTRLEPTAAAGVLSVFYTQNPSASFEGLTTGAFVLAQSVGEQAQTTDQLAAAIIKVVNEADQN
ncbi:MAG TPA: hypothetical protein VLE72_04475 [Candidatus Saccharimonadales bacterium]|nr:hypothetical protein [Candidatus Saccharimonadales bacterium]